MQIGERSLLIFYYENEKIKNKSLKKKNCFSLFFILRSLILIIKVPFACFTDFLVKNNYKMHKIEIGKKFKKKIENDPIKVNYLNIAY